MFTHSVTGMDAYCPALKTQMNLDTSISLTCVNTSLFNKHVSGWPRRHGASTQAWLMYESTGWDSISDRCNLAKCGLYSNLSVGTSCSGQLLYYTQQPECWLKWLGTIFILYSTTRVLVQASLIHFHIIPGNRGVGTSGLDPFLYYTLQSGCSYKQFGLIPILYLATRVLVHRHGSVLVLYSATGVLAKLACEDSHIILNNQGVGTSISDPFPYCTWQLGCWYKRCRLITILYSATGLLIHAIWAESYIILSKQGVGTSASDPFLYYTRQPKYWQKWLVPVPILYSITRAQVAWDDFHTILSNWGVGIIGASWFLYYKWLGTLL